MKRRSLLKTLIAALGTGSFAFGAKQPSSGIAQSSDAPSSTLPSDGAALRSSMIEAHDGTRIHFRDWGAGRPIVFVAPWASAPTGGTFRR